MNLLAFLGVFTGRMTEFPILYDTSTNPYRFINLRPEKWTPFKRSFSVWSIRELKQRRRRRQRERQKSNWVRLAKQQLWTCIRLFCAFLCLQCTTTTWKCLILRRFMEDVNTTRNNFLFLFLNFSRVLIQLQKNLPTFNKMSEIG